MATEGMAGGGMAERETMAGATMAEGTVLTGLVMARGNGGAAWGCAEECGCWDGVCLWTKEVAVGQSTSFCESGQAPLLTIWNVKNWLVGSMAW
jgi:hypothetical protein